MNDTFNLAAPPGFRGLQPDLPIRMYLRNLPHWRQHGATYFVTFRLADVIPQDKLQALKRWRQNWERETPVPRSEAQWRALAKQITSQTEKRTDEGYGECELRDPRITRLMCDSLLKFQGQRYFTACYVVMPNHVHAVMKPLGDHELEILLKNMRGYVARQTSRELDRSGTLWEEESYDRIIRDEEHLFHVVRYIGRNPSRAGLPEADWHRWMCPEWQKAGWRFEDS